MEFAMPGYLSKLCFMNIEYEYSMQGYFSMFSFKFLEYINFLMDKMASHSKHNRSRIQIQSTH